MMPNIENPDLSPAIEVDIFIPHLRWKSLDFDPRVTARLIIAETLRQIDMPACFDLDNLEISVVLASDDMVSTLNKQYKKKIGPTNVLSFPMMEGNEAPGQLTALGDIVLALETIAREAQEQEKSFKDHMTHLIVHGMLHLIGYDHETDEEAEVMEALEVEILQSMGVENPYKET